MVNNRLGGVLGVRNDDGFGHHQRQKAQTESRDLHDGLVGDSAIFRKSDNLLLIETLGR